MLGIQTQGSMIEGAPPQTTILIRLLNDFAQNDSSSIFTNSLMVNATTNETFPQLFAFPQLIDPYNPPRIVRRDAEGNEIEEEQEDQQVNPHLSLFNVWSIMTNSNEISDV